MATQGQKIKVGIFLVISLAVIVSSLLLIAGYTRKSLVAYWVEFDESVLGLHRGGPVVYMGVPVGTVDEILLTDDFRARIRFWLDPEIVTLREGVRARLGLYSLAAGTMCVSLSGGEPEGRIVEPESMIPSESSLIESVSSQVEEILYQVSYIVADLRLALEGVEEGEFTLIIRNLNELLQDSRAGIGEIRAALQGFSDATDETGRQFGLLVEELAELTTRASELASLAKMKLEPLQVDRLQNQAGQLFTDISELGKIAGNTLDGLHQAAAGIAGNTDHLEYQLRISLQTMNETLESIRQLVDYLYDDPSALVRGRGQPEGE